MLASHPNTLFISTTSPQTPKFGVLMHLLCNPHQPYLIEIFALWKWFRSEFQNLMRCSEYLENAKCLNQNRERLSNVFFKASLLKFDHPKGLVVWYDSHHRAARLQSPWDLANRSFKKIAFKPPLITAQCALSWLNSKCEIKFWRTF